MVSTFDKLKEYNGKKYTGMQVGGTHKWFYNDAEWEETKTGPDEWTIKLTSIKQRKIGAPKGSGVPIGTGYKWFLIGEQNVEKLDEDRYKTEFTATKYKLGHMRNYWKGPSFTYEGQKSLTQLKLDFLKKELLKTEQELEGERNGNKET